MKPCTRCGQCCREGKACDIRRWLSDDGKAELPASGCELLVDNGNGTTTCLGIVDAFERPDMWWTPTQKFVTTVLVGRGCELEPKS